MFYFTSRSIKEEIERKMFYNYMETGWRKISNNLKRKLINMTCFIGNKRRKYNGQDTTCVFFSNCEVESGQGSTLRVVQSVNNNNLLNVKCGYNYFKNIQKFSLFFSFFFFLYCFSNWIIYYYYYNNMAIFES